MSFWKAFWEHLGWIWEAFGTHVGVILSYFWLTFPFSLLNSVPAVEKVDPESGKVDLFSLGDPENDENNLGILDVS